MRRLLSLAAAGMAIAVAAPPAGASAAAVRVVADPRAGRDGKAPVLLGAGVYGSSRFVDNVSAWQTVEPAIDFTATAALAFALTG